MIGHQGSSIGVGRQEVQRRPDARGAQALVPIVFPTDGIHAAGAMTVLPSKVRSKTTIVERSGQYDLTIHPARNKTSSDE